MLNYSDALMLVWQVAAREAGVAGYAEIQPANLFVALSKVSDSSFREQVKAADAAESACPGGIEQDLAEISEVFRAARLDPILFRRRLRNRVTAPTGGSPADIIHRSADSRSLFVRAESLCRWLSIQTVRPVHLLQALAELEESPWALLLAQLGVQREDLLKHSEAVGVRGGAKPAGGADRPPQPAAPVRTPILAACGRDLTELARQGKLGKVVGRSNEVAHLGRALLRKSRNNAILVGEPGVGKTAIVEALAQRIASGKVPEFFLQKRIVDVSISSLVAGAKYRGDFEERMRGLLAEASSDPNVVIFFDEIHTLMGAGAGSGDAMDASNIMKPALARGDIACIGATTTKEYRRFIEADPAFQRRFELIWVDEPTREEAEEILQGVRPSYEAHHSLKIGDEVIAAAVDLSIRYLPSQRLPDKAIELLDDACVRANFESFTNQGSASELQKEDLMRVLSEKIGGGDPTDRLLDLEEALTLRVRGQGAAIGEVAGAVRTAYALDKRNVPRTVLLLVGPSGTGKTELAKTLASRLFGSPQKLITFDMSEYTERHTVSKLIGAPPGYVGYENEGLLTGAVRTNPCSVVLFDEIEKAHPEVLKLLLQVFGEGRLTDSQNRRASFTETVILMTSNLGAETYSEQARRIGFQAEERGQDQRRESARKSVMKAVQATLPPELLGRIQKVVQFDPLEGDVVREIADMLILESLSQFGSRNFQLQLDEGAYELLIKHGSSATLGARAMRNAIERLIIEPLSLSMLEGGIVAGSAVRATVAEDGASLAFPGSDAAPGH